MDRAVGEDIKLTFLHSNNIDVEVKPTGNNQAAITKETYTNLLVVTINGQVVKCLHTCSYIQSILTVYILRDCLLPSRIIHESL